MTSRRQPSRPGPSFLVHGAAVMLFALLSAGCKHEETKDPTLASIAVTPAAPTATTLTSTQQFTATGTYSDGTTRDLTRMVTWLSTATHVATINNAGLATAVAGGATTITASSGGISGSTAFTVTPALLSWDQANWNTVHWQ